jgi:hypothetical protein
MRILVCDDKQDLCDEIVSAVQEGLGQKPEELVGDERLTPELTRFFESIKTCLGLDSKNCTPLPATPFDQAVVILDNNLTFLKVPGPPLTAESIAGYLRAFTQADYLISLNLNNEVDFDLRFLVGDYSTRADLALNTSHLANRALWTGNPADARDGFLPWYWPRLNTVATKRKEQITFIRDHFDEPVLKSLGFDKTRIARLSPHALGALSPKAQSEGAKEDSLEPEEISFLDVFVSRDRSLPVRDERKNLAKAIGNDVIRDIVARTVAADIDFWFRRHIVGPQEPLVDVPHLLMRLPFVLGSKANDLNEWNKFVNNERPPFGLDQKLYEKHLAPTKYEHDLWVPHTCFWWHELKNDPTLDDLFFAAEEGDWADVVFCEDRSIFVERLPSNGESPIEFPAEFEGAAWGRRHVVQIQGYQYAPRSLLAS